MNIKILLFIGLLLIGTVTVAFSHFKIMGDNFINPHGRGTPAGDNAMLWNDSDTMMWNNGDKMLWND